MEKIQKEILGTDDFFKDPLENLLTDMQDYCTELIKYKPLISNNDLCEYYEDRIRDIYRLLIRQFKYFFADYYREKIDNVYSKAEEFSLEAVEKTVETVKTTLETVEETDEES